MIAIERMVTAALRAEGIRIDRRVLKRPGTFKVGGKRVPYSVGISCRIGHGGVSNFSRFAAQLAPSKSVMTIRVPFRFDPGETGRDLALYSEIDDYRRLAEERDRLASFLRFILRNAGRICDAHVKNLPAEGDAGEGNAPASTGRRLEAIEISFGDGWVYSETYNTEGKRILREWGDRIDVGGAFDAAP